MALNSFNQLGGGGLLDRAAPQFQQQPQQQQSPFQPQFQPQQGGGIGGMLGGLFGGGGGGGGGGPGGIMSILRGQFPQLFPQQPGPGGVQQFNPFQTGGSQLPLPPQFAPPGQPIPTPGPQPGPAGIQPFEGGIQTTFAPGSTGPNPQPGPPGTQQFAGGGQQFSPHFVPQQPGGVPQPGPAGIQPFNPFTTGGSQLPPGFGGGQAGPGIQPGAIGQPGLPPGITGLAPGVSPFQTGGSRVAPPQQPGLPPGVQRFTGQPIAEDFGLNRPQPQLQSPRQGGFGGFGANLGFGRAF